MMSYLENRFNFQKHLTALICSCQRNKKNYYYSKVKKMFVLCRSS